MKTDYGLSLYAVDNSSSDVSSRCYAIRYPYSIVKTKSVLTAVDCSQFAIISDLRRVNNNYVKIVL